MMIGRADTQDEVTSQHDIDTIDAFVISNGLPFVGSGRSTATHLEPVAVAAVVPMCQPSPTSASS